MELNDSRISLEIGLKNQINRQVGLKRYEQNKAHHNLKHLLDAWKYMLKISNISNIIEMIWEYVDTAPDKFWKPLNSEVFGIYTTIGEYRNKKGDIILGHFTDNNKYIGSVKTLGNKPISYNGYFKIEKHRFYLNVKKLNLVYGEENFHLMFEPIPFNI